jgi:enamine deaminase RidA (YjgF/YER057c/UK114 family)
MELPASTLVGVSALAAPEWLIEIEAIAIAD